MLLTGDRCENVGRPGKTPQRGTDGCRHMILTRSGVCRDGAERHHRVSRDGKPLADLSDVGRSRVSGGLDDHVATIRSQHVG